MQPNSPNQETAESKKPTQQLQKPYSPAGKRTPGDMGDACFAVTETARTKRERTGEDVSSSSSTSGRERLKRHWMEVSGRVWIPDSWGQEGLLKDWIDCTVFDAPLVSSRIMSARAALAAEGRRSAMANNSTTLMRI